MFFVKNLYKNSVINGERMYDNILISFFVRFYQNMKKNPEQKMKGNKKKKELGEVHNRNIVTNRDNGENMNGISKVTSYEIIPQIDI